MLNRCTLSSLLLPRSGSSTTASLRTIEQAIELRCSTPSPQLPSARALDLESGQAVCAKSEDGVWYRATVKTVQDTNVTVSELYIVPGVD